MARQEIDFEDIRQRHPLEDVIEREVGPIKGRKVRCPFHADSSPSLHIYPDGTWHCFGACGVGGDVIDFLARLYFGGPATGETLFLVLERLGEIGVTPFTDEERERRYQEREEQERRTTQEAQSVREKLFLYSLRSQHKAREEHKEIFRAWGISEEWITRARLGFDGKRLTIPAFFRGVTFGIKRRRLPALDVLAAKDDPKYNTVTGSVWGLYNADVLLSCPDTVIVCEDEKSALAICSQGGVAIATTGGAGFWCSQKAGWWERWLAGIPQLYFWRDADSAGLKSAMDFQRRFRRAEIVDSTPYKDASDALAGGIELAEVIPL